MSKEYRYFTLYKLNNKKIQFGRVKITLSAKPIDAAKKLLNSICKYEGISKLKCKANFYIRETTKDSTQKKIYGPYKGSFKKYNTPVIIKKDGKEIKYTMYSEVVKIKGEKIIVQKGGEKGGFMEVLESMYPNCVIKLKDGRIACAITENGFQQGKIFIWDNISDKNYINSSRKTLKQIKKDHNPQLKKIAVGRTNRINIHLEEYDPKPSMIIVDNDTSINCLYQLDDGNIITGGGDVATFFDATLYESYLTTKAHYNNVHKNNKKWKSDEGIMQGGGIIKVWDINNPINNGNIKSAECIKKLYGHKSPVIRVVEASEKIIISQDNHYIKIWNLTTDKCIYTTAKRTSDSFYSNTHNELKKILQKNHKTELPGYIEYVKKFQKGNKKNKEENDGENEEEEENEENENEGNENEEEYDEENEYEEEEDEEEEEEDEEEEDEDEEEEDEENEEEEDEENEEEEEEENEEDEEEENEEEYFNTVNTVNMKNTKTSKKYNIKSLNKFLESENYNEATRKQIQRNFEKYINNMETKKEIKNEMEEKKKKKMENEIKKDIEKMKKEMEKKKEMENKKKEMEKKKNEIKKKKKLSKNITKLI